MTIAKLEIAIRRVRKQLDDYPPTGKQYGHMYSEIVTRYLLIDPVIQALDWDLHDFDQAAVEWPLPSGQYTRKADYVLFNRREIPRVVIEAKYRGRNLTNHEAQLEGYVEGMLSGAGVLTDGMRWRIYNLRKRGPFTGKHEATVDVVAGTIADKAGERRTNMREMAQCLNYWLDKDKWW